MKSWAGWVMGVAACLWLVELHGVQTMLAVWLLTTGAALFFTGNVSREDTRV